MNDEKLNNYELGITNDDWVEAKFNDILEIVSGKSQKQVITNDGKYPIYGSGGIIGRAKDYLCEEGTTIIGRKGTINSPIYVKEQFWNVDTAFGLSPFFLLENRLLFFYAVYFNFKKLDKSTTVPSLAKRDLLQISFPLPPLPIQRAIVSKIESLFSDLDHGIANLKKAQEQLKIYRQAVLKKAFEGELTKEWREKQRTDAINGISSPLPTAEELLQQIKEERQNHYNQQIEDWKKAVKEWETVKTQFIASQKPAPKKPTKPKAIKELPPLSEDELNELPKLPEGWKYIHPEKVSSTEKYSIGIGPFGSNLKVSDYTETGIPLIFVRNITKNDYTLNVKYTSKSKFDELIAHSVKPLDILITKMGDPPGDCSIYPSNSPDGIITSDCIKFRIWNKYSNRKYFKYCIETPFIKRQLGLITQGVAQKKISLERFKTLIFPLCSLPEQHQIVQEIETRLSVCDKMEQSISESLKKANALRQSILKKAFEGKLLSEAEIEACKQEADYEPASVLLEKIKAEKLKREQEAKKTKKKSRK